MLIMNNIPNNTPNKIEFNFTCYALKLLGHNLYSNPWTAVSEIVANGIDAKAKNVYVLVDLFDKEHAEIEIIDNGRGMSYDDLCNKYTIIGRNKRLDDPNDKTILGRKGVGKLAALFLSDKYYLTTKSSSEYSSWYIDVSGAKDDDIPSLERCDSEPPIVARDTWEKQSTGTVIKLTNVNLKKIGPERLKALPVILSDYYLSDVIDCQIEVCVRLSENDVIKFVPVQKHIFFTTMYAMFDNTNKNYLNKMKESVYLTALYELPAELDRKYPTIKIDDIEDSKGTITVKNIANEEIDVEYKLTGWIGIHGSLDEEIQQRNDRNFKKIINDLRPFWNELKFANMERYDGQIKRVFDDKGYGFICCDLFNEDVYFKFKDFKDEKYFICEGINVSFYAIDSYDYNKNRQSHQAIEIEVEFGKV